MINFPSAPTNGQTFTSGGITWTFDGTKWTVGAATSGVYMPIAGGTFTGAITAPGETLTGPLTGTSATFSGNVNAAGETLTGPLTGTTAAFSGNITTMADSIVNGGVYSGTTTAPGRFVVLGPGGTDRQVEGFSGSLAPAGVRWSLVLGNPTLESGGNAGSDFALTAFSDTGANLSTPLAISRAFGNATLNGNVTMNQNLTVLVNAFKPGGGAWVATSDARIKNVQSEYTPGLDEVLQLRPVAYTYKGNDSQTADSQSMHAKAAADETPFVGLIAQEVETVFPGMVTQGDGYIDGEKVSDLRTLDTGPLIFALCNAVKELSAKVAALEAA